MHIAINGISTQPGGGLTVLAGLVQSLRDVRPEWQITVFVGNIASKEKIESLSCADSVHLQTSRGGSAGSFIWQNTLLGGLLKKSSVDALIAINHYCERVECPQVVYHLNLRRFSNAYRSFRPLHILQEYLRDRAARRALCLARANVFESCFLLETAKKIVRGPIRNSVVAYIGLPDELLEMSARPGHRQIASLRIAAITSPQPHKDNPTLIRMLAHLREQNPCENWQLDILGGTSHDVWRPLRSLAESLGVGNAIKWHGFCHNDQITAILDKAICLVSTSRMESFAMVALEAMARGCPCVVADCSSMPESVGQAALLAVPGDSCSFASQVSRIANDEQLQDRLVEKGKEHLRHFRWINCGHAFVREIERIFQVSSTKSYAA